MKNIKMQYVFCGMILATVVGMWLGFGVSSATNFPAEVLELISLLSLGVMVIFVPFLKLRWRLVLLIPIAIAVLGIFAISMSVGVTFKNNSDARVNISCIEISSHQIRRLSLSAKHSRKLILCRGDSPSRFRDKAFAVLASDSGGNIYYEGIIGIADIEKQNIIELNKCENGGGIR